jgi:hypothetical protein
MYKTPTQLAQEALGPTSPFGTQPKPTAPAPIPLDIGQPVNNYENKKIQWIAEARRLNPDADGDTLSKIYDQKVAISEGDGTKPWIKDKLSVKQQDAKVQDIAKQSLHAPDFASNQAFLDGVMRGIKDMGQGAKQLYLTLGEHHDILDKITPTLPGGPALSLLVKKQKPGTTEAYTKEVNKEIEEYEEKTKDNYFSSGAGRLVGNVISSFPLMGAGIEEAITRPLLSKIISGGITGTMVGGLIFDPTGESRGARALAGGLIGSIIPGGLHGAGKTLKWLFAKPSLIDDPAVLEAAAERVRNAKELGLDGLTAGAVTRDPKIQTLEKEMLKKSGAAADLFREAHQEISDKLYNTGQEMIEAAGGKSLANKVLGGELQTALETTRDLARKNVSKMYKIAENAPGANKELPREDILKTLNEIKDDFVDFKLSPGMEREFGEIAELSVDKPKLQRLFDVSKLSEEELKNFAQTDQARIGELQYKNSFDVKRANKFIMGLNKIFRTSTDKSQRLATSALMSKVMDSIDTLADDGTNPSRVLFNLSRQYRKQLANIYDQKDVVGALLKLKSNLTKYIAPEDVADKIFRSKESITNLERIEGALKYHMRVDKWLAEARKLNPDLDLSTLENIYNTKVAPLQKSNAELWDNLRASKLNDILKNSTKYINGTPQLSYKALVEQAKATGEDALNKIFGNAELANKFYKLIDVMDTWQNKAPTVKTQSSAVKAIQKSVGGLFGLIGSGETRVGGIIHFPINIIKSLLTQIQDERWVRANLTLGAEDTPKELVSAMKHSPHVIDNIMNFLKHNKILKENLKAAATRGMVAGALTPEGGKT